jgi:hypothetical protein
MDIKHKKLILLKGQHGFQKDLQQYHIRIMEKLSKRKVQ